MFFTIGTDDLRVTINTIGAELNSVKYNGCEYLWQGKPEFWPRRAPVLFPIVGRLKDNTFKYKNRSYSLTQHGFARDKEFSPFNHKKNSIEFNYNSTKETFLIYPFSFTLTIRYEIVNSELITTYKVKNNSDDRMFFSIGAHPGFKVPLTADERFEDFYLDFLNDNPLQTTLLSDGLLTGEKKNLPVSENRLQLSKSLFENDALVFEDAQINSVELKSSLSGKGVRMQCENWPYFGIWSKKGCDEFVCLEPWYGVADHNDSTQEFTAKKGILTLERQKEFSCSFKMLFF